VNYCGKGRKGEGRRGGREEENGRKAKKGLGLEGK
jgi:hypothetical protein